MISKYFSPLTKGGLRMQLFSDWTTGNKLVNNVITFPPVGAWESCYNICETVQE